MDEMSRLTLQIVDPTHPVNRPGTKPDVQPGTRCSRSSSLP